jgi:filamentous hemagglutinin family protein
MKRRQTSARSSSASTQHRTHPFRRSALSLAVAACLGAAWQPPALANPQGGIVIGGNASISQRPGVTTVNQGSGRIIINWNGFSVEKGELTQFKQPGKEAIALNRVTGKESSKIHGRLQGNGNVWLVNRNGVLIGKDARVDVHGFLATTADIKDRDFMAGRYEFSQASPNPKATVVNEGTINIGEYGLAALVAPQARNDGVIQGRLGKVIIAGAPTYTLDFYGDGLIQFEATSKVEEKADPDHALAENNGRISVDGGSVLITASAASQVVDDVINVRGVVEARSFKDNGGRIVLDGGPSGSVQVAGRLDTSGVESGAKGGTAKVLGEKVRLTVGAKVDASGDAGGGEVLIGGNYKGKGPEPNAKRVEVESGAAIRADAVGDGDGGRVVVWSDEETAFQGAVSVRGGERGGNGGSLEVSGRQDLIFQGLVDGEAPLGRTGTLLLDPTDIEIRDAGPAPNVILTAGLEANLSTVDVAVSTSSEGTDQGDIRVNGNVEWSTGTQLTLSADNNIVINSRIDATPAVGANGGLVLSAGGTVTTGPGGAVDVGLFELQAGSWVQNSSTLPAFSAIDFRVDPGANFLRVVGGDGSAASPYLLTDIYGVQGVGSPNYLASNFRLANDIDASRTAGWYDYGEGIDGFMPIGQGGEVGYSGTFDGAGHTIGGLFIKRGTDVGLFQSIEAGGTVQDLTLADVSVSGYDAGGLAARNFGSVENVAVSGTVNGLASDLIDLVVGGQVGGLIARNEGTVAGSFFDGIVVGRANFASQYVGGLIGFNIGTITRSGASGSATVEASYGYLRVGGFVGSSEGSQSDISDSTSSTVVVVDASAGFQLEIGGIAGGFIGDNGGLIRDSSASGSVTVSASGVYVDVGGFAGANSTGEGSDGVILRSRASGAVALSSDGTATSHVGGFVGYNSSEIKESRADGGVTSAMQLPAAPQTNCVGGFAGCNVGTLLVTGAYGNVSVSPAGNEIFVGGHTGSSERGAITDSLAQGDVMVKGNAFGATGGLVGSTLGGSVLRTYASGAVSAGSSAVVVGGLIGQERTDPDISPTSVVASFWDTVASGQSTSAAGTRLTTAQLQDTQGFQALATPLNWDFQQTWAPGAPGFYPDLYAISPVIYAVPAAATGLYGQLGSVQLTGSYYGGPSIYVFGPPGDMVPNVNLFGSPGIPNGDVGTYPVSALAGVTSALGQVYRIVGGTDAVLTVTPAALTIRALDQSKTYGDPLFDLGTTAFSVAGLVSGDTVTAVDLSSDGAALGAGVTASGYAISPSNPVGSGLIGTNGLANYDINYVDGVLMVDAAPLTILADNASRSVGQPNPAFTASFSGFKLGDNESVVSGLDFTTQAARASPPGAYAIVPYGATAQNYQIDFANGELLVLIGSLEDFGLEGNVIWPDVPLVSQFAPAVPLALEETPEPVSTAPVIGRSPLDDDLLFSSDGNREFWGPPFEESLPEEQQAAPQPQ